MKKLSAVLGLATLFAGLTIANTALAFQNAPPQNTGTTTPTQTQKKSTKNTTATGAATNASQAAPAATGTSKADTAPASGSSTTTSAPAKSQATKQPIANASPSQIADAKAKGLVWVNTSSKVYHKSGDKYYGATKSGEFMTEADAQKAGAHLAK